MLRIIAGQYRGKKIVTKEHAKIRPTSSRARESIFNILLHGEFSGEEASPLINKSVVDVFCGTGALGLEALSRGAGHVTFIDQSQESISLARQNAANLGVQDVYFIRSDSTSLPKARQACHLAFLDPPYDSGLAVKSLASLHKQGWLVHGAIVVVEMSARETLTPPPEFTPFDERLYSNTKIAFLRYTAA